MSWELGARAAGSWISISSTQQGGESSRRLVKAPSNNLFPAFRDEHAAVNPTDLHAGGGDTDVLPQAG